MKNSYRPIALFFLLVVYFSCSPQSEEQQGVVKNHQAVEYLVFRVDSDLVDQFIALDHEIWTKQLKDHPGFISKEIWINENNKEEVTAIIYWNSYEEWKSIPSEELQRIEAEFDERFGANNYDLVHAYHNQNKWYKVLEYRKE